MSKKSLKSEIVRPAFDPNSRQSKTERAATIRQLQRNIELMSNGGRAPDLGAELSRQRQELNIPQEILAEALGVSTQTLGRVEKGSAAAIQALLTGLSSLGLELKIAPAQQQS